MCSAEVRYKLCDWCEEVQDEEITMKINFTNSARALRICDECYKLKPKRKMREDQILDFKKQVAIDLIEYFKQIPRGGLMDKWRDYNIVRACEDVIIHINHLA